MQRQEVRGWVQRKPGWQVRAMGIDAVRRHVQQMEQDAWLCAILIGLSACQTSVSQVPRADVNRRMHALAVRYVHDEVSGMTGVIADLQNCYVSASQFRAKANALRDCLILDAVAFYEANRFDQAFGATGLPYSNPETKTARWSYYEPLAGFNDVDRQLHYMTERAALVETAIQSIGSDG